jgi:MFS family permease
MADAVDVAEEIAAAPFGRFHLLLGLLIGLVLFFDGYDLFNGAYVAPYVRAEWSLEPVQLGVLLSAGICGLAVGSLSVGYFADWIGRRAAMLCALWLVTIASALMAVVVHAFVPFLIVRLVLGCGVGMLSPLCLTYINEWAPRRSANRFATTIFVVGFAGGGIGAGLAGIFLAPQFGWRALYAGGALSFIVTLACHRWLPESMQFLAVKKRWVDLNAILVVFRPERAAIYRATTEYSGMSGPAPRAGLGSLRALLMSRSTLVIWIVGALSLFCVHGLTNWLPTVFIDKGASTTAAFSLGIMAMVAQIIGGLGTAYLADRWRNRRLVMSVGFAAAAVSALALGLASTLPAMTLLLALATLFLFGAQAVLNNFTAVSYPTSVRATGMGLAGVLGPLAIGVLQGIWPSTFAVFLLLAIVLAAAALVIMLAPPEATHPL